MKRFFQQNPYWLICFIAIILATTYWGLWASDRYVSQSNVVLENPQIAQPTLNIASLIGGGATGSGDMLLLRDYLLSVDMLKNIDTELGFRMHYSNKNLDIFSRLSDDQAPIEELHHYYLKQVSVELDEYAQILRIKAIAYSPEMSHAITTLLLKLGEAHMNAMGQRLAEEQVRFLEKQVKQLNDGFTVARQALLDYQNEKGLVSPAGTIESLNALVASLEAQLTALKAKRTALTSYQSALSPEVMQINREIDALAEQVELERARMTTQSGYALNAVSSKYQTLELKAQFAQESYSGALAALQNTRIEAARKLKQVSVLQSPTFPEYPLEPKRLYNVTVFTIIALFVTLIIQMMVLIIKDHRD